jgi:hypothetical protein
MPAQPEDYYNDGPDAQAANAPAPEAPTDDGAKTSILPKSFFADDVKVGDQMNVKVTAVHDNDVEVEPATGDGDEDDSGAPPETQAPPPDEGSMQSMME